jgi:Ni,Fe-hydrogenase III large subunit
MALESAWGWKVPRRALWLRALLLERERLANHLGDLGAIGNDAGFTFGLTQFMRLKEICLRLNKSIFGHRFMMDCVSPGGVSVDPDLIGIEELLRQCDFIEGEVSILRGIYDEHSGLQDRFVSTGYISQDVALELGLIGLAGRASGIAEDVRITNPSYPYTELNVRVARSETGDVAGRVSVRFDEIVESLRLMRILLTDLPEGNTRSDTKSARAKGEGAGWVEGWRGGIFVSLSVTKSGEINRCHVHDPSWQNWPVLEFAVIGDIVPDFPLINKSFNLTYSGHDR